MKDENKYLLKSIGFLLLMIVITALLIVVPVWIISTVFESDIQWLEQHGLRGIWCGTGGCDE